MRVEQRLIQLSPWEEEVLGCSCMRGQSARDEAHLFLPLCSGFEAVAARAGSGSHLQNEVEDACGMG